jgi:hypothetical protein
MLKNELRAESAMIKTMFGKGFRKGSASAEPSKPKTFGL